MSHRPARRGAGRAGRGAERPASFTSGSNRCLELKPQRRDLFEKKHFFSFLQTGSSPERACPRGPRSASASGRSPPGNEGRAAARAAPRLGSAFRRAWALPRPARTGGRPLRSPSGERRSRPERGGLPVPPAPLSQPERTTGGVHPPRWPRPGGIRTGRDGTRDLPPRALARDSAESGAAGEPQGEGANAPRCPERSRGDATPRGGAAATGPVRGWGCRVSLWARPQSRYTWPAQPLRRTRAQKTLWQHALVKELVCSKRLRR